MQEKKGTKTKNKITFILVTLFPISIHIVYFFFKDFIYLFLERGEGRGKEGRKDQCMAARVVALTGDLACNTGMCPDWESNWRPFGSQPALNPLSYTSQRHIIYFSNKFMVPSFYEEFPDYLFIYIYIYMSLSIYMSIYI